MGHNQAQLKPGTLPKLKKAVPGISDADLQTMQRAPMRGFNQEILKEPNVYRTYEAVTHYGESIKALINEKFGDGIMSAIDFYLDVGSTTDSKGDQLVKILSTASNELQVLSCRIEGIAAHIIA